MMLHIICISIVLLLAPLTAIGSNLCSGNVNFVHLFLTKPLPTSNYNVSFPDSNLVNEFGSTFADSKIPICFIARNDFSIELKAGSVKNEAVGRSRLTDLYLCLKYPGSVHCNDFQISETHLMPTILTTGCSSPTPEELNEFDIAGILTDRIYSNGSMQPGSIIDTKEAKRRLFASFNPKAPKGTLKTLSIDYLFSRLIAHETAHAFNLNDFMSSTNCKTVGSCVTMGGKPSPNSLHLMGKGNLFEQYKSRVYKNNICTSFGEIEKIMVEYNDTENKLCPGTGRYDPPNCNQIREVDYTSEHDGIVFMEYPNPAQKLSKIGETIVSHSLGIPFSIELSTLLPENYNEDLYHIELEVTVRNEKNELTFRPSILNFETLSDSNESLKLNLSTNVFRDEDGLVFGSIGRYELSFHIEYNDLQFISESIFVDINRNSNIGNWVFDNQNISLSNKKYISKDSLNPSVLDALTVSSEFDGLITEIIKLVNLVRDDNNGIRSSILGDYAKISILHLLESGRFSEEYSRTLIPTSLEREFLMELTGKADSLPPFYSRYVSRWNGLETLRPE